MPDIEQVAENTPATEEPGPRMRLVDICCGTPIWEPEPPLGRRPSMPMEDEEYLTR